MRKFLLTALIATLPLSASAGAQSKAKEKSASPAPMAEASQNALKLPAFRKVKLANGITVLLMEQHEVPIISVEYVFRSGSVYDPKAKAGVASMTAELLRKGTKMRTAAQIAAELDFIGMTFESDADVDASRGSAEFLKKDTAPGLDLLADLLMNPVFPAEEFDKLQRQRIDGIKAAKDNAGSVIRSYYNAYLYGGHPYGRPVGGDENSLAAIARNDVVDFYQSNYTPSNLILALAGDFDSAAMEQFLQQRFGAWRGKPSAMVKVAVAPAASGKRLLLVDKPDSTQTYYLIGNVGIARNNPDRVAIQVVNTLFGGRFTSMLNSELRIKSGLTYGARSFFTRNVTPGSFAMSSYTRNATTEKALDMTLDILKRLHEKGVSAEELGSAKAYIKGQFPPTVETTDQLAALLANLELYGLDEGEINNFYAQVDAVTPDVAKRVIAQYFPLDNLVFVLIGKTEEINGVAKKYAPKMDTKNITDPEF